MTTLNLITNMPIQESIMIPEKQNKAHILTAWIYFTQNSKSINILQNKPSISSLLDGKRDCLIGYSK